MRLILPSVAAAALAALAGGCGSDHAQATDGGHAGGVAALTKHQAAIDAPHRDSRPALTGRKFLEVRLTGMQMGTSDVARFAEDGSAVLVRSYGGGGFYTFSCHLEGAQLADLRRAAADLPLDPAPNHKERTRPTFYTPPAPSYVVERGRYIGSFTQDAIPANGRVFARYIKGLMFGQRGHCQKQFGQRPR